jgi:hypothetical protein
MPQFAVTREGLSASALSGIKTGQAGTPTGGNKTMRDLGNGDAGPLFDERLPASWQQDLQTAEERRLRQKRLLERHVTAGERQMHEDLLRLLGGGEERRDKT